jgi:hypothetical protein
MSDDQNLGLDLNSLFQPVWTQGDIAQNLLKKFGDRGAPAERHGGDRRDDRRGGPRRERERGRDRARRPAAGGDRQRRPGGGKFDRRDTAGRHGQRLVAAPREEPAPLPEVGVEFIPDAKAVEVLAQQIKTSSRAYPLFKLALMLLEKPEYYSVRLTAQKSHQSLFLCALDDTPWAKENEAVLHVLSKHLATFYQSEKVPIEPPKGVYTFVAQCGMSGAVLGPPNYHDYQIKLRELHEQRFARMPFEAFKARVKITRDEALLNQWREEMSFKTEYVCLNVPEPLRLTALDEVNKHFRATHKDYIIKRAEACTISGVQSRKLPCDGLHRLVRRDWERLRQHPLPFATELSRQLARHGLQFFKVNKTVTYINVARPKALDLAVTPVSDSIRRIVEFLSAGKKHSRKRLLATVTEPPPAPAAAVPVTPDPLSAVGEISASLEPATMTADAEAAVPPPAAVPVSPAAEEVSVKPAADDLTPWQQSLLTDLHWLVHQGYVIEFADGHLELAKRQAA